MSRLNNYDGYMVNKHPISSFRGSWRVITLFFSLLVVIVITILSPPVPQSQAYHHFADGRMLWGIPNFLNVVSNVAFIAVGGYGLLRMIPFWTLALVPLSFRQPAERLPYVVLISGIFLTGFGSAYYHLAPNDAHLVWDRLPMTIGFMGLLAAIIMERIDLAVGRWLLFPLLAVGIWSVYFWYAGDLRGAGDLRFYADVQFYPLIAIPLILLFYPSPYSRDRDWWWMMAWYALAKLFELQDHFFYSLLGVVSGHTLKHLAAAAASVVLLYHLRHRRPVSKIQISLE